MSDTPPGHFERDWVRSGRRGLKELRPYIKCPNCGLYKLTRIKKPIPRLLKSTKIVEYKYCFNCKLTSEKEEISKD